MLEIFWGERRK